MDWRKDILGNYLEANSKEWHWRAYWHTGLMCYCWMSLSVPWILLLKEQLRIEPSLNSLEDFDGLSILVTHDRDEAFQFCDELIILDEGQNYCKRKNL